MRTCLLIDAPHLIKSRRVSRGDSLSSSPSSTSYSPNAPTSSSPVLTYASSSRVTSSTGVVSSCPSSAKKTIVGSDMVDWLLTSSAQTPVRIHSRSQATSMLQVLFEDRVLLPAEDFVCLGDGEQSQDYLPYVRSQRNSCPCSSSTEGSSCLACGCICSSSVYGNQRSGCCCCNSVSEKETVVKTFQDKYVLYKFWFDCEGREARSSFTLNERRIAAREFAHSLAILCQVAPDAHLRTILRKRPEERTEDDISLIFDELIQIPALSELTASVKQELAHVISYEFHPKKGTVGKQVIIIFFFSLLLLLYY